jgi:cob(I)alamin adenosyltransferase
MPPLVLGLIQVYTGNGKGKTTAALGLALRARAVGKRVGMVFFDKGGEHYSERKLLGQLGIDWFGYGLDRIDPKTERFRFGVIPDDVAQAEQGIAKAKALLAAAPPYDLIILDEVNTTVALGMLEEQDVEQLIDAKSPATELVLTGRIEVSRAARPLHCDGSCVVGGGKAHEHRPSYFDRADLLTEMRLEKHYFYKGTPAREGIDF